MEQLLERGLGRSQALRIFQVSLIPKINWALRIEDYVKETIQDYKRIDEQMEQTFYLITTPRQFTEEDFMGEQRQITIQNFMSATQQNDANIDISQTFIDFLNYSTIYKFQKQINIIFLLMKEMCLKMPIKLPIDSIHMNSGRSTRKYSWPIVWSLDSLYIKSSNFKCNIQILEFPQIVKIVFIGSSLLKATVFPYGSRSLVPNILDQQKGIDIERIFRANEIRQIQILLLFLILNQLRGFCSRCRNRVQNIVYFPKLILIVLLSAI
ncbi:Hypothetical_protein [Hexamita inflata]|uniref:Hypothetical_protein n=1 Tax=Hexamita inflata TaxID=28002 RepID=A0AA86RDE7_9EUKA|nr:Hypothetical protein HINF_LOCUS60208 [Hexamita inflata]